MRRLAQMEREFKELERRVQTLKQIEKELSTLDAEGFKSDILKIKSELKDLDRVDEAEKELSSLRKKIKEEIEVLISDTEIIINDAIHLATEAKSSDWLIALEVLRREISYFYGEFDSDKISYVDAMASILKTKERAEVLSNPPKKDSGKPVKELSLEDLAYRNLHVSRNASSYEILGISNNADKKEVKKAYRDKIDGWHGDRFRNKKDNEMVSEISKIINNAKDEIYKERGWRK